MSVAGVARDLAARLRVPFAIPEPAVDEVPADAHRRRARRGRRRPTSAAGSRPGSCAASTSATRDPLIARRLTPARHAADQHARRRVQLRDARARAAEPPLRPGQGARRRVPGPAGPGRRARSSPSTASSGAFIERRPADLRRRRPADRHRRRDGRRRHRDRRHDHRRRCSRWPGSSRSRSPRPSRRLAPALRGVGAVREGHRSRDHRPRPPALRRAAGRRPAPRLEAGTVDVRGELPDRTPVRVRTGRLNRLLGTELDGDADRRAARAHRLRHDRRGRRHRRGHPVVALRLDRRDRRHRGGRARTYGYTAIGRSLPSLAARRPADVPPARPPPPGRAALRPRGMSEAMPLSFLAPGDLERSGLPGDGIAIANPLVAEESVLRTSLLPGLVKSLATNAARRNTGVGLFEIGHVFRRPADGEQTGPLPDEREMLAVALGGRDAPDGRADAGGPLAELLGVRDGVDRQRPCPGAAPDPVGRDRRRRRCHGRRRRRGRPAGARRPRHRRARRVARGRPRTRCSRCPRRPARVPAGQPSTRRATSTSPSRSTDAVPASAVEARHRPGRGRAPGGAAPVRRLPRPRHRRRAGAAWPTACGSQAPDRTLTDDEVAEVRRRCIDAVEGAVPAALRG